MAHATQTAYALALATYDTALRAYHAELDLVAEPENDDDEATWDAFAECDVALRNAYRVDALLLLVTEAADDLIDWSTEVVREAAKDSPEVIREMADVLRASHRSVTIRRRLTEIALSMAAA